MATLTVLYDACVLYPAPLRDLLLHLALTELFAARWTETIHEEWISNLLKDRPDLRRDRLERTRRLMNEAVPGCLISEYEDLIPSLHLPDPDDRHVLAAAVRGGCDAIVTCNLDDFPAAELAGHGIQAIHPDAFILNLIGVDAGAVYMAVKRQRQHLRNPPRSAEELLRTFEGLALTKTADHLRQIVELL